MVYADFANTRRGNFIDTPKDSQRNSVFEFRIFSEIECIQVLQQYFITNWQTKV